MPCVLLTNNGLLPANQRASDVASLAVENIIPIQQQRINAAFHVQGIQCAVYRLLQNGRKCSCQAKKQKLNTRLNSEGNASPETINELLVGTDFGVTQYTPKKSVLTLDYSEDDNVIPSASNLAQLWNKAEAGEVNMVGDNTVSRDTVVDDEYNGFDPSMLTLGDYSCPVCFGSGYVGGYSLYNGSRIVIPCDDMNLHGGILNVENYPFSASAEYIEFSVVLPKGAIQIDSFRLLNNYDIVPCKILVDNQPINNSVLLSLCDGKLHRVSAKFNKITDFTHFEIQINQSVKSSYIEFPKLSKGSDLHLLDSTDSFQLLLSPDIPIIDRRDIITDTLYNKAYYVMDTSWLNTRQKQSLGWEINVRVIQPQESFYNLPRRYRAKRKDATVLPVIGNIGNRP